ncbi:MAG: DDE-type integrase/transposase/recombinase [Proteobacteria bacterium]|nr:DDE-type integrase/transposase/recombinase [Pseudomonadota bacterium]
MSRHWSERQWRTDAGFCVEALEEALDRYGPPEIMNTDQGSQFTGSAWITTLTDASVRVSMDGRGRCMDNVRTLSRTGGVRVLTHRAPMAVAQIRGGLPARTDRRLQGRTGHPGLDRLL